MKEFKELLTKWINRKSELLDSYRRGDDSTAAEICRLGICIMDLRAAITKSDQRELRKKA